MVRARRRRVNAPAGACYPHAMGRRALLTALSATLALLATAARSWAAPVPDSPAEAFAVGRMLALEGDFAGALDLLHRVVEASPRATAPRRCRRASGGPAGGGRGGERPPADPDVLRPAAEPLLAVADGSQQV